MRGAVLALALAVVGCGAFRPTPPAVLDQVEVYTVEQFATDRTAYEAALLSRDIETAVFYRNRMLWAIVSDVNRSYFNFRTEFSVARAGAKTAAQITTLAMSTAATVMGGSAVLSAAVTAIQGTQLAVDQNLFEQQTNETLLTTLDALREEQLATINRKLLIAPPQYGFQEAFDDALRLYNAGTIASGLQRMSQTAAQQRESAQSANSAAMQARIIDQLGRPMIAPTRR